MHCHCQCHSQLPLLQFLSLIGCCASPEACHPSLPLPWASRGHHLHRSIIPVASLSSSSLAVSSRCRNFILVDRLSQRSVINPPLSSFSRHIRIIILVGILQRSLSSIVFPVAAVATQFSQPSLHHRSVSLLSCGINIGPSRPCSLHRMAGVVLLRRPWLLLACRSPLLIVIVSIIIFLLLVPCFVHLYVLSCRLYFCDI